MHRSRSYSLLTPRTPLSPSSLWEKTILVNREHIKWKTAPKH